MTSEAKCTTCDLIKDLENKQIKLVIELETVNVLAFRHDDVFGEIRISVISKKHIDDAIDFTKSYEDNELAKEIGSAIKEIESRYGKNGMELYTDMTQQSNHARCFIVYEA